MTSRDGGPGAGRRSSAVLCTLVALIGYATVADAATAGSAASAPAAALPAHPSVPARKKVPTVPAKLVDINGASAKELKTLPGVDDAVAAKIVANRPYLSKAELVTKNVMPTGPYLSLKDQVVAMQKTGQPKAKR